ncbi:hypothetical protein PR048_020753, partial [Dryococelus australis]
MLLGANTPLEKADDDSVCTWLQKYIPGRHECESADETTDEKGWCIFIILIRVLTSASGDRLFVGGVTELDNANGTECCRGILSVLAKYNIKYENVVLWGLYLPALNMCVSNVKHAFLNSRKRKHGYRSFLQGKYPENEKNTELFPSPLMTRWNSWFHSVEYIAEYLEDLTDFLTGVDSGVSAKYFTNLNNCECAIIHCSAEFLMEHGTPLIKHILELEGSSYNVSHKLYPLLSDLENNFLLVSRGIFRDKTSTALSKLPTPVKKCQMTENLKNFGLKCATKLQNLREKDSAKPFFSTVGNLYAVRNVVNNPVNEKLFAVAKTLPIVTTVTQKEFLEGYLAFQAQTAKALEEEPNVVVCQVLQGLKNYHTNFVSQALAILWIPASNVDCERGFSTYRQIFSDLCTSLITCNIEIMLTKYFSGR